MKHSACCIEPLENRIAPASLTFSDVDGDLVTITTSKGTVVDLANAVLLSPTVGLGQQLQRLDLYLLPAVFAGTNVSVTAKPQDADLDGDLDGDGLVNLGYLNATGVDLGKVTIDGDLGKVVAGNAALSTPGLKSLTVHSLGTFGTTTGAANLNSSITGGLGSMKVLTNLYEATLTAGSIGSLTVLGGSYYSAFNTQIGSTGDIGAIKVGRDFLGKIESTGGKIASLTAGGDLGTVVAAKDIGPVKVGGDIFRLQSTGGKLGAVTAEGNVNNLESAGDMGAVVIGSSNGGFITSGGKIAGLTVAGTLASTLSASGDIGTIKVGQDFLISITVGGKIGGVTVGQTFYGTLFSAGGIGAVKIGLDLDGAIFATGGVINTAGKLASVTIGRDFLGSTTNAGGGEIYSQLDMGVVKIGGSVVGGKENTAYVHTAGKLAGVTIGGDLTGGSETNAGYIKSTGDMGNVTIGGYMEGGSGANTGTVSSEGRLAGVTVGVYVFGGAGLNSGTIFSNGNLGAVKIGMDLRGGFSGGPNSGVVQTNGDLASVTIGGSLIGGAVNFSGVIYANGALGTVKIGNDLIGGSISTGSASTDRSGYIFGNRIGSVTIGDSIRPGFDSSTAGNLLRNASIRAENDIGSITIRGDVQGNTDSLVSIYARGKASLPGSGDVAIGKITIGGNLSKADIRVGYSPDGVGVNADAQIGTVTVGGDWISTILIAGVSAGGDGFANSNDAKLGGIGVLKDAPDAAGGISKIASVIIKGQAIGTVASNDSALFAIEAQEIVSISVGGTKVPLLTGKANDTFGLRKSLGSTVGINPGPNFPDFFAFEVGTS